MTSGCSLVFTSAAGGLESGHFSLTQLQNVFKTCFVLLEFTCSQQDILIQPAGAALQHSQLRPN